MPPQVIDDETCRAFSRIDGPGPDQLLRFIVGEDTSPRPMPSAEIESELGDPFATHVLLRGVFPTNADQLLAAIDAATGESDPLRVQMSFVVDEGSQLNTPPDQTESTNAGLRFLVTRGNASQGPELIISASDPSRGLIELMAWDATNQGFNFYRNLGGAGGWVWAGNSRHALSSPSKGKGPFESHPSGNLLMKELKLPWLHWDSFKAHVLDKVFDEADPRRTHRWFVDADEFRGAEICETAVVIPSIQRWTKARLDRSLDTDGRLQDPSRLLEHVVTSPTVNLVTSETESVAAALGSNVRLPPEFFVDVDGFATVGLPGPPQLEVSGAIYTSSLQAFDFRVTDGNFSQPGDVHFAFVVPERAFEDNEVLRQMIARGLITKRLAATLLMVDFPNPVFSERRAALLRHVPAGPADPNTFSQEVADAIIATPEASSSGTPEREFADRWNVGDSAWRAAYGAELNAYYEVVKNRTLSQDGFNDFVRLAESRRNRVRDMPIFESRLLFPETNIPPDVLTMGPDGTVKEPGEGE